MNALSTAAAVTGAGPHATPAHPQPPPSATPEHLRRQLQAVLARVRQHSARRDAFIARVDVIQHDPHMAEGTRAELVRVETMNAGLAQIAADEDRASAQALAVAIGADITGDTLSEPAVAPPCSATIVIHVTHDRILTEAQLHMCGTRRARREWLRVGTNSFKSTSRDLAETHEDRLGIELCEFMDGIDLPTRVANMLPRRPEKAGAA